MSVTTLMPVVACVLVDTDRRILVTSRPDGKEMAGYFEFPGGKIEAGETAEQALVRELQEEIGIDTTATCLAPLSFVTDIRPNGRQVVVLLYICRRWKGFVQGKEGQICRWIRPQDLREIHFLPNNEAFIPVLMEMLT